MGRLRAGAGPLSCCASVKMRRGVHLPPKRRELRPMSPNPKAPAKLMRITTPLLTLALAMTALPAHPQDLGFVTGLFKEVHSVTVYAQSSWLDRTSFLRADDKCLTPGLCGAGTEVLIDLTAGAGAHLELGLGASYSRGLHSSASNMDLRGSVRSFPTFSVYGTREGLLGQDWIQPYLGASFGLAELWNAQAYDVGNYEYGVKSQTFEWGGTGGMYFDVPILDGLFAELSYRRRRFASIDYVFPAHADKQDSLPTDWPRALDMSGFQVALGLQFDLKRSSTPRQSLPGVWALTAVEGEKLPTLVEQRPAEPREQGSERREITSGRLTLNASPDSTYHIEVFYRTSRIAPDGKLLGAGVVSPSTERGVYRISPSGAVTLRPMHPSAGEAYQSVRMGNELLVRSPVDRRQLHFTKPAS